MSKFQSAPFQDFFRDQIYVTLKNCLYNYRLRKRAVERRFREETLDLVLEVGSGISPVMTKTDRIVYSDLSFDAMKILKKEHGRGFHVVADATALPFRHGAYSHVICSEVLEHVPDDVQALKELSRVLKPEGRLLITFPHRKFYFTNHDRLVNHWRRYERDEMTAKLTEAGLNVEVTEKLLGPLEMITMYIVVVCFNIFKRFNLGKNSIESPTGQRIWTTLFSWVNRVYMLPVWLDAQLTPIKYSTVLLMTAWVQDRRPGNRPPFEPDRTNFHKNLDTE